MAPALMCFHVLVMLLTQVGSSHAVTTRHDTREHVVTSFSGSTSSSQHLMRKQSRFSRRIEDMAVGEWDQAASSKPNMSALGTILVGSAKVPVRVVMDTGSTDLIIKSVNTIQTTSSQFSCPANGVNPAATETLYSPTGSTTYNASGNQFKVNYGSGSATVQRFRDTVSIGGKEMLATVMGEVTEDALCIMHGSKPYMQGIAGLMHTKTPLSGKAPYSVFHRLRSNASVTAFSFCATSLPEATISWLTGTPKAVAGEVTVPNIGKHFWTANLSNVGTGSVFNICNATAKYPCAAIVDTGTSAIMGPKASVDALKKSLGVAGNCSNYDTLPDLTFSLGEQQLTLPKAAYVMRLRAELAKTAVKNGNVTIHMPSGQTMTLPIPVVQQVPTGQTQEVCMPALFSMSNFDTRVSIEGKNVSVQDLWILGQPLFKKYYVRFQWLQAGEPQMFMADRSTACVPSVSLAGSASGAGTDASQPLGPTIVRSADEIILPGWVDGLTDV